MMEIVYGISAICLLVSMTMTIIASVRLTAARRLLLHHLAEAHAAVPDNDPYRLAAFTSIMTLPDGSRQASLTEVRYFHALEAISTLDFNETAKRMALVALGRQK